MGNVESHVGQCLGALKATKDMKEESDRIIKDGGTINQFSRKILHSYLANVIPVITKTEEVNGVEKTIVDHEKWKALVEWPLGYFICGEDPEIGLAKIREQDSPPEICGKVFDIGDPTYTCKDCAADPTCVFCHDCFQRSSHVTHRYRMHTSSGNGGFCDCGDVEAWKRDPTCEKHAQGSSVEKDPKEVLPNDIWKRATFLYKDLLQYCIDLVLWLDYDHLPRELRRTDANKNDSTYLCMLYNDEVHTYEQVIRTLQQVVGCDKAQAIRYATVVDKEGRSLIYSGTKEACLKICKDVRARTSTTDRGPLKCEAIERDIVSHQVAIIELLSLLNSITNFSVGLRRILCDLTLNVIPSRSESLVDELLKSDTSLWKVARAGCHQLFMNAILLDSYGKVEFAVSFAKAYRVLMKDFIEDDHDHGISASSISVQIFTVPTLTRKLFTEQNILEVVLKTFMDQLAEAVTDDGNFDFQHGRAGRTLSLKRECYILHDLGYLLLHKPEPWTQRLREVFLNAFDVFALVLRGMQGMEQVVRKLLTHVEYEPNWETGFLLQLWIMPVIEAMVAWCTSDTAVLTEVVERCLKILINDMPALKFEVKNHTEVDPHFKLINYSVALQPVSVHLGLSRFIAGILTGSTKNSVSLETLLNFGKKSQEERNKLLLTLMEYPLRTLVFAAQVSAGLWRRNGYAVLHQVSYYQNVRCVSEMYDKDIVMLQTVAALMDGDYFLTCMLDKYGLLDWLSLGFEESDLDEDAQRRTIVISEEFLLTVLAVLGERHVLGVGEVSGRSILRKEVVHRLALGPASRSEIVKNLPSKDPESDEDCTFESLLDDVLKSVAEFREPGLTGKGLYHIKQNCLEECSQYFYHYSRSEQSKALEQRRKETKKSNAPAGCKVPMPANFTKNFLPVTNLFCCNKMAKILVIVLFRATRAISKITPDTLIEEALHIIALGLYEEKRRRLNHCVQQGSFLDVVTKTLGVIESKPLTIQSLLQDLQSKSRNQEYAELIDWILSFLYDELSHKNDFSDDATQFNKRKQDQVDHGSNADKERKARLAKEKREKVMAQMSQMQKSFIRKYEDLLQSEDEAESDDVDVIMGEEIGEIDSVAVGPRRTITKPKSENIICILCQEKQDITATGKSVVMAAFLQRSKVLSLSKGKSLANVVDCNPLYPPRDMFTGVFTNTCGHVMHSDCWQKYFDAVKEKEGRQLLRLHLHPRVDVHKNEYLCPLCSSFCNAVVPVLPPLGLQETSSEMMGTEEELSLQERILIDFRKRLDAETSNIFSKASTATAVSHRLPASLSALRSFMLDVIHVGEELPSSTTDMIQRFSTAVDNVGLKNGAQKLFSSSFVMSWNSCSYTIQATESLLRGENKGLVDITSRQTDCLGALVRYCAMGGSISNAKSDTYKDCLRLLAALIPSDVPEFNLPCIVDLNVFATMVNLRFAVQSMDFVDSTLSLPDLLKDGTVDRLVLDISAKALLTQLLLPAPADLTLIDDHHKHIATFEVKEALAKLWGKMRHYSGIQSSDDPHQQPDKLFCHIFQCCLPFIRSTALFFHFLTGVPLPNVLSENEAFVQHKQLKEAQALCLYLSLPLDIVSLLPLKDDAKVDATFTEAMIERWCKHLDVKGVVDDQRTNIQSLMATSMGLIPLPREYSTLLTTATGFRCPITGDISQNPTICLVCGEMLCSQSYCCQALVDERQIGSCTAHAEKCSETIGVFLLIRDCQILLLYNRSKGCLISSPYLDEYGEPDVKFRRGNPLYLSSGRYENLQKLWLSHSIPQEIVRQLESNRTFMSVDWPQFL